MVKIASISIADYSEATEGMPHDVERLYFRMILKMLSREDGLPDDDAENARMFGYDQRVYRRLKAKLVALPNTVFVKDGMIRNERVDSDLQVYRHKRVEAAENGRKGGLSKGEVRRKSARSSPEVREKSGGSPAEVREKLPSISHATDNKNNLLAVASPSPTPKRREERKEQAATAEQEPARAPPSPAALLDRLMAACNGSLDNPVNCLGLLSSATPQMWLDRGADLERDVIPTLEAAGKKYHGKRIRDWGYFTGMIADAKAKRERALPEPSGAVSAPAKARHEAIISRADAEMMRNARPAD